MALGSRILAVAAVSLVAPLAAVGAPIFGALGVVSGSAVVTLGYAGVTFQCFAGGCPASTGDVTIAGGSDPFSSAVGTRGFLSNLETGNAPLNASFLLSNFMTFASPLDDIAFDLTFLNLGFYGSTQCGLSPAAGQYCTPEGIPGLITASNPMGLSEFNFENLSSTSSQMVFSFSGFGRRISTGELSNMVGSLAVTFDSLNFQSVLAMLDSGGTFSGTIDTTYRATFFLTPIPEPSPAFPAAGALGAIGCLALRRRKRSV